MFAVSRGLSAKHQTSNIRYLPFIIQRWQTTSTFEQKKRAVDFSEASWARGPFNYVHGKRVDTSSGQTFANINPTTGNVLCHVGVTSDDDVSAAVRSAKAAFQSWSGTSGLERGKLLREVARIVRERSEELAVAETVDMGRTIWESRIDVAGSADTLDYYAGIAGTLAGQHITFAGGSFAYTRREPLGVVGAVGAWNYPLQMAVFKSAPALACGNTVVFKPSELTPVTAAMLAEIYTRAGLPDGSFNVVQGPGNVGDALSRHPDIAKITFTGSVRTGSKVMETCAQGIKKVTLELGGKSPLIIFDDADLENALRGTMLANYLNQGQVCSNGTRVFVQRPLVAAFLEKLSSRTKALKVGDPMSDDVQIGPIINDKQADKILSYIQSAKNEGATLLCGGEEVRPSTVLGGRYISPCVLVDCHDHMTAVREEIFGPVAAILVFDTEEEVIARANDSEFGLAGGVFTRDISRAHRVAAKLEAGAIYINTFNVYPPEIPFGGKKKSGIGRENGAVTVEFFTELKSVYVEAGDVDYPF